MTDQVNHPKHYMMLPDMEAIEGINLLLTQEEYIGYLKGNFFKYRFRAGEKGSLKQDIAKSNWYRDRLKEEFGNVAE